MLTLHKLSEAEIISYLIKQQEEPFSYSEVGFTRGGAPHRYNADRLSIRLGQGSDVFQQAKQAIRNWRMFPEPMTKLCWPDRPIVESTVVAVLFRAGCFWSLNPCRVIYTIEETEQDDQGQRVDRFGFAYGTLCDHVEQGEEWFGVEWRSADDSVWYDLYAISRPRHWLARLVYPYARWQQRRFRLLSGQSMQRSVAAEAVGGKCSQE